MQRAAPLPAPLSAPSRPLPPELPFEPFLVLPRKSERLLMAAGLMQPLPWHPLELRMAPGLRWNTLGVLPHQLAQGQGQGPQADAPAEGKLGSRDGPRRPPESLRDVMAIASWLHSEQKGAVTDLAAPLLCAAYQRAISPDDLYDLYRMDMGACGIWHDHNIHISRRHWVWPRTRWTWVGNAVTVRVLCG